MTLKQNINNWLTLACGTFGENKVGPFPNQVFTNKKFPLAILEYSIAFLFLYRRTI